MKHAIIICSFLLFNLQSIAQSILNGSFEDHSSFGNQINLSNPAFNSLMNNVTGFGSFGDIDIIVDATYCGMAQDSITYIAFTGSGTDAAALKCSSPLVVGQSYILTFWDRGCNSWVPFPFNIGISQSDTSFGTTILTGTQTPTMGVWTQRTVYFVAPVAGQYITVWMNQGGTGDWAHIDNFVLNSGQAAPIVALSSSDTSFCEKHCLSFNDLSTNNPTSWQWYFPGAIPDTSTSKNPTNICYNGYGSYDVKLVACNANGCDSITLTNFINENKNPVDSIYGLNDTIWSLPFLSYQWYEITAGLIAGATNQYYVPTATGSYYCVANDSIGCVATSNNVVITAISKPQSEDGININPNPNEGIFVLEFDQPAKANPVVIRVLNLTGQIIFERTLTKTSGKFSEKIDLQNPPLGIYFIQVASNGSIISNKIIVK